MMHSPAALLVPRRASAAVSTASARSRGGARSPRAADASSSLPQHSPSSVEQQRAKELATLGLTAADVEALEDAAAEEPIVVHTPRAASLRDGEAAEPYSFSALLQRHEVEGSGGGAASGSDGGALLSMTAGAADSDFYDDCPPLDGAFAPLHASSPSPSPARSAPSSRPFTPFAAKARLSTTTPTAHALGLAAGDRSGGGGRSAHGSRGFSTNAMHSSGYALNVSGTGADAHPFQVAEGAASSSVRFPLSPTTAVSRTASSRHRGVAWGPDRDNDSSVAGGVVPPAAEGPQAPAGSSPAEDFFAATARGEGALAGGEDSGEGTYAVANASGALPAVVGIGADQPLPRGDGEVHAPSPSSKEEERAQCLVVPLPTRFLVGAEWGRRVPAAAGSNDKEAEGRSPSASRDTARTTSTAGLSKMIDVVEAVAPQLPLHTMSPRGGRGERAGSPPTSRSAGKARGHSSSLPHHHHHKGRPLPPDRSFHHSGRPTSPLLSASASASLLSTPMPLPLRVLTSQQIREEQRASLAAMLSYERGGLRKRDCAELRGTILDFALGRISALPSAIDGNGVSDAFLEDKEEVSPREEANEAFGEGSTDTPLSPPRNTATLLAPGGHADSPLRVTTPQHSSAAEASTRSDQPSRWGLGKEDGDEEQSFRSSRGGAPTTPSSSMAGGLAWGTSQIAATGANHGGDNDYDDGGDDGGGALARNGGSAGTHSSSATARATAKASAK